MGYIDDESMVRVDFFKESGKWYTTEAVKWTGVYTHISIHDAFLISLRNHFSSPNKGPNTRLQGMTAVCLEPYHEHSHPLMILWSG